MRVRVPGGHDLHFVASGGNAAPQRAGDNGAGAFDGEATVDGKSQRARGGAARRSMRGFLDGRAQLVEACSRAAGYRHHVGVCVGRCGQPPAHLVGHERRPFVVYQVALRQRHHARGDGKQFKHGKVLFGLRA